jgi:hypothetical protein
MSPHNSQNPHNWLTRLFKGAAWPYGISANPHNPPLPRFCEVVRGFRPGCVRTRYTALTSMFGSCAGSAGCVRPESEGTSVAAR